MHTKPHLLFVCTYNQWRSRTAEEIYRHDPRFAVRSAGTSRQAEHTITVSDIEWADAILVMEKKHAEKLLQIFSDELKTKEIYSLNIPDGLRYMDPELVALLKDGVEEWWENYHAPI